MMQKDLRSESRIDFSPQPDAFLPLVKYFYLYYWDLGILFGLGGVPLPNQTKFSHTK